MRGRRLRVVPGVRPTESRIREALFSIWLDRIGGCRFLDLFAGSGAMGLEALSRGAEKAVFVDQAPPVLAALRRNLEATESAQVRVLRASLPAGLHRLDAEVPFDIAFADPPYAYTEYDALLEALEGRVSATGQLVIEHACRTELSADSSCWVRTDTRRYGDSCLSFYCSKTASTSEDRN